MVLNKFEGKESLKELFNGVFIDEPVIIKGMSFEDKVDFIRSSVEIGCCNYWFIKNLLSLLSGASLSIESECEKDECFFQDFEEYIDLKTELRSTLKEVKEQIVKFFIGSLKAKSFVVPDLSVTPNEMYFDLMCMMDINTVSSFMGNSEVNIKDCPVVSCANILLDAIFNKEQSLNNALTEMFMEMINYG